MKRISIYMMSIIGILLLAACGAIEDTNGEDTSLVQITSEQIISHDIGWSASGLKTKSERAATRQSNYYANEGFRESDDYDYFQVECKSGSGITNLIATKMEEGQVAVFTVESQIESGNLKIVLLKRGNDADELIYEFTTNEEDTYEYEAEEFGIYYVRAAVESFEGSVAVSRQIGE